MRIRRDVSLIAHSPNDVELRHGIWNPISYTLRDEDKTEKLFAILSDLRSGVRPKEIARRHDSPRSDVEGLIDRLVELGVMESGPATAIDYHLEKVTPLASGVDGDVRRVRMLGDSALAARVGALVGETVGADSVVQVPAGDPGWARLCELNHEWLTDAVPFAAAIETFEPWKDDLVVLAQDVVDPLVAQALNRVAREVGFSWLYGAMDGPFLFVGPLTVPGEGGCFECFERRVTMNLRAAQSYQEYKSALADGRVSGGTMEVAPVIEHMLAAHLAFEVTNFALTGRTFTVSKVLAIYLPTMEISFNEVLKLPGCAGCDSAPLRDEKELYFDLQAMLGVPGTNTP